MANKPKQAPCRGCRALRKKLREQKDINEFILDSVTVSEAPSGMMMVPDTPVYAAAPRMYEALDFVIFNSEFLDSAVRAEVVAALKQAQGES